jgi:alpha-beta hydrolase superfamily lysophospholipase
MIALSAVALAVATAGAPGPPRSLKAKCVQTDGVRAKPFWLTTSDGVRLYAIEAGRGATTVVLMHEYPVDLCGWLPYVRTLTAAGVRVLAFDFRNYGDSGRPARGIAAFDRDLRAAVGRARADGARSVFVAGASFGGVVALTYSAGLRLAGVISMSGETHLLGMNALAGVSRLRAPLLILGSRQDRYLSVAEARQLLRRAGSKDNRLVLYAGGFHGWQIVEEAPYGARARALVLKWIRARAKSAP